MLSGVLALVADIVIKNQSIRILALYAPANLQRRKEFADELNNYYTRSYNINNHNSNNIDIIAGDFNCLDINELEKLSTITANNTNNNSIIEIDREEDIEIDLRQVIEKDLVEDNRIHSIPDELATIIESIKISNNLIDMDINKTKTFNRNYYCRVNKQIKLVSRRLDRIYVNHNLINYSNWQFKNYRIPIEYSDHNFIQTKITIRNLNSNKRNCRWRISNNTITSPTMLKFIDSILDNITTIVKEPATHFTFNDLLDTLESIIQYYKEYQTQHDYNSKVRINHLKSLLNTEFNNEAIASLAAINKSKHLNHMMKQEINNYSEELSLKYIAAKLKKRENDFNIPTVKDTNGNIYTNQEDIEHQFINYYSELYASKIDDPIIHAKLLNNWKIHTDNDWKTLDDNFTKDEILHTINQLNPHKSPGPDGLSNLFYITHKTKLAPLIASAFNDLLNNNTPIPESYKEGLIITIPKKGDPQLIKNRRPITLANCIYKIHSKVINNRILRILPKVINNNQKGFVPNRFIIDNIITTNEVIKYCNLKKLSGIITFYDFEKAFDSISHNSIFRTLEHIKIPVKLINQIKSLLNNSTARIEINKSITKTFKIERGVKQGDPLSPTLFVLVIEVLARSIINDKNIIGLPLNNSSQREKFQGFADDSQSLVTNSQQLNLVLNHFNEFCKATSSKLNYDKSVSILIGDQHNNDSIIPISNKPERYLGYYFNKDGIYRKLPEILNSIRQSLVLWKAAGVTIKTKVNILKAFALSKLIYYSYVEDFNKEEIKEINKIVDWFLSASNNKSYNGFQVINLMSTKRSKYEMKQGGWNIWNIEKRQQAQKLWLFNHFIHSYENNTINSAHHKSWKYQIESKNKSSQFLINLLSEWYEVKRKKCQFNGYISIKNTNNEPLSLAEWYKEINVMEQNIPKTEFQKELKISGYNYNKLFTNVLKVKEPKSKNTLFRFHSRSLPLNFMHNKICPLCNINIGRDPYGHLFFECSKTISFINIDKLNNFIFNNTGKFKNWKQHKSNSQIIYKFPLGIKNDGEINEDYKEVRFHPKHFTWSYRAVNFDLNRCYAYRNLIALILHHIWLWICNNLYNDNNKHIINQLDYELLEQKWNKLATLEYIKRIKIYKDHISKSPESYKNNNIDILNNTLKLIKSTIIKQYYIKPNTLPHINTFFNNI